VQARAASGIPKRARNSKEEEDVMDERRMVELAEQFLAAWNTQEVERVLDCYTEDVEYLDPNTRGPVRGAEAMRRYLGKLFGRWQMHWSLSEAHLFAGGGGCAVLWRATFTLPGGGETVEIRGMDRVEVRGDRIARNEVYFDRTRLAPLLAAAAAGAGAAPPAS
jgi:ketosteroid isomerase-like protein